MVNRGALLLLMLTALLTPCAAVDRPNVIFVFADDLGWGDLGVYGNRRIATPHLDQMAKEGTLFTQFYVNGSVCSPSRTAVMTGRYPARYKVHGHLATHEQNARRDMPDWLDTEAPMLTRMLKEAGYATAHFGKWHLGAGEGSPDPGAYGIDDHRTVNSNGPGWEDQDSPDFRAKSTRLFVDETLRFIRENRERSFYVNLWTLVPHATLNPTKEQMEPYLRFGPKSVPYIGTAPVYYGSVSDLDAQVGRLLHSLDEMGLSEETLVIFSSDNGPEDIDIVNANHSGIGSPGPLRGRKRSLYEGGVRVPFIVRWKGRVPAGKVDDESVIAGVDLLPSLCALARVPVPMPGDGEDRSDVLVGIPSLRKKPLYWEWRFRIAGHVFNMSPMLAIRDGRWKLLMNPDRSRLELYDIPADPREMNNVADKSAEVVRKLSAAVLGWQTSLPRGMVEDSAGRNNYPWPGRRD